MRDLRDPVCLSNLAYVAVAAYAYYVHDNLCFGMILVIMAIISMLYHMNREVHPYRFFDLLFGFALFVISCIGVSNACGSFTFLGITLILSKLMNSWLFLHNEHDSNHESYDEFHELWHWTSAAHLALVSHFI
jgi:hypothetical protein